MKKGYAIASLALLGCFSFCGLVPPDSAQAGPLIEFGDEGYMQLDLKFQGIADFTDFGSGADGSESRSDFYLRRARISITGMYNDTWGAKLQTCGGTSDSRNPAVGGYALSQANSKLNSNIRLVDGYLFGLFNDALNMKVGMTKNPMNRANLDACFSPLATERSSFVYSPFGTDATKDSRDMGIVLSGNFFDDHLKYWGALMEGRDGSTEWYNPFVDTTFISTPEPSNNFSWTGRLHYSFFDPELGPTAMGYKGTYLGQKGTVLTIGGGVTYEADAAYKNTAPAGPKGTPDFLKGRVLNDETVDYTAWTADIFYEQPFDNGSIITATALYLKADMEDAYKTALAVADQNTFVGGVIGQREGWYLKAGYVPPFRVFEDGMFQVFARYESWDLASFLNVHDQTAEELGLGFNYFPLGVEKVRFSFEWSKHSFDKPTKLGDYLQQTGADPQVFDDYNVATAMFMVEI